jgi:hypothetical protein
MEDKLSRRFGLSNARQANLAASTQIKPDFDHQDLLESVQDLSGRQTATEGTKLLFEADPQTISQEGDENMSFDPRLDPVKDRTQI